MHEKELSQRKIAIDLLMDLADAIDRNWPSDDMPPDLFVAYDASCAFLGGIPEVLEKQQDKFAPKVGRKFIVAIG